MKVRMLTQMSGTRADGQPWPVVGDVLDTSDEEGMALCRVTDGNPYPIAEPVAEQEKRSVETRENKDIEPEKPQPVPGSAEDNPADAPPPKRGPGRPRKDDLPS